MDGFWERFERARISRRRALTASGATAAALAAMTLVGCDGGGGGAKPTTTSEESGLGYEILNPAGPPRQGGTLISANAANFGTFDPHVGIQVASAYFPRIYNVLVNQSATRPEFMYFDLAQSMEMPEETTFIFKLRPGVKVSPNDLGVPERDLDGEDVRASLDRVRTDKATNNYAFAHNHIQDVRIDGDTVTITTPGPYAWFLNRIGLFTSAITPRELMAGDLSRLATQAAGAGAYRLLSVTEGEMARLSRNPNFYRRDPTNNNAQLPYIDALEVRTIFDKATQRTAFQSGQIHQYMTGSGEEARSLGDATIQRNPYFAYISVTMNPRQKPFDDPRVRRAFSRALNRQAFVDLVYNGDAQADGLVQWSLGSFALPPEELESTYQPFSVEEARALVRQVGGIKAKVMYPAGTAILEHSQHVPIFLKQMEDAGIEIEQDAQDFGSWINNYHDVNYQCSLALNQPYETPELPLAFHTERGPFGDGTYIRGLGDPAIEEAVRKASAAMDDDARIEAVHEAQRVIYAKDPMMLPLVTPYNHVAYRRVVKNIPTGIGTSQYIVNTAWMDV